MIKRSPFITTHSEPKLTPGERRKIDELLAEK